MKTEVRRAFYDQYAKLVRTRIDHYHRQNGGVERFLNDLLLQPYNISDGFHHDIADSRNAIEKFEHGTRIQPIASSLMAVEILKDMKIQYEFSIWLQVPENVTAEDIHLGFKTQDTGYEMIEEVQSSSVFDQLPESYWNDHIRIVKDELSFGTIMLLDQ